MKKLLIAGLISASLFTPLASAENYIIDDQGAHASINFKIKHLGYSWLTGRFNTFTGKFSYDPENISASSVEVNVDTSSISSNHAERDKHLKGGDFLDIGQFGSASFVSSSVKDNGDGSVLINGTLSLHGVSKKIAINATKVGEGNDPWGGYRAGFSGTTRIGLKDFGIDFELGPQSTHVELELNVEGVQQ
jgi:polyisoprenoid-binding protein YceI